MTDDYLRYYDLEQYLFVDVHARFHQDKKLDAFDLFSIIIWKANRAKSKLAHRLIKDFGPLEETAEKFTSALYNAASAKDRLLMTMFDWGFYLPMASSILSVLYPEDFTVYDYRVCEELESLGEFRRLGDKRREVLWDGYQQYCAGVREAVPEYTDLRQKDQYLWGRSAATQLRADIANGFQKPA